MTPFLQGFLLGALRGYVVSFALLCLSCVALQPKPGGACQQDEAACAGKNDALICRAGRYVKTSCNGPQACTLAKDRTVLCDQTEGVRPGEPCLSAYEGQVQCLPDDAALYARCSDGVWAPSRCVSGICKKSGDSVACEE